MARETDAEVVNLVCEILNREHVVYDAIITLGCTVAAISRVTRHLTTDERIELSEFMRDVGDEIEHRREPVKV